MLKRNAVKYKEEVKYKGEGLESNYFTTNASWASNVTVEVKRCFPFTRKFIILSLNLLR
jgi:hypothetical protein